MAPQSPASARRSPRSRWSLLIFIFLPFWLNATGCCVISAIYPAPPLPPPLPREKVVEHLSGRLGRIETLKDMGASLESEYGPPGDREETLDVGVDLAFDATLPGLWLHAEKVGQVVFTLRTRKRSFSIEIPDTKELVTGSERAFRKLPHLVRPEEISSALGTLEQLGITESTAAMEVDGEYYRFDVYRGLYLVRRLYVSRREIEIRRIIEYDASGRKRTVVHMRDYDPANGISVPNTFIVERPIRKWRVTLELSDPEVNVLSPERIRRLFNPPVRPGWTYINLDVQPLSDVRALQQEE